MDIDRPGWQEFRATWLKDIVAQDIRGVDGSPIATRKSYLADVDVAIPAISFGQVEFPSNPIKEYPEPSWNLSHYSVRNGDFYTVRDAVVRDEIGMITVGSYVLRDSLHLTLPEHHGFKWIDPSTLLMPPSRSDINVGHAAHLICGFVGNRNYAHWITDVLPSILIPPFGDLYGDATLLLSQQRRGWQQQTLDLMPEVRGRVLSINEKAHVHCSSLAIVPQIKASDWFPHPARMNVIKELRQRVGAEKRPHRRIYIARKDSASRRMVNEDEVIALVRRYGYEVVMLAGMSVADQIRLFSASSHVIAPHGAALANIVFCQPGTVLCELFMDSFVQWAYRRLASIIPMTYGCLIGSTDDWNVQQQARTWVLPIPALESALQAPPLAL